MLYELDLINNRNVTNNDVTMIDYYCKVGNAVDFHATSAASASILLFKRLKAVPPTKAEAVNRFHIGDLLEADILQVPI